MLWRKKHRLIRLHGMIGRDADSLASRTSCGRPMEVLASADRKIKNTRICTIVPSYNAGTTLHQLLETLIPISPCVVVVDDGSEDDTASIAKDFDPFGVVLLQHERNRGKGAALRTGFYWAIEQGFEVVVTLDSDLQHSPDDLPRILEAFERDCLDMLVGSRLHNNKEMPKLRRFGNCFSSWIATSFCHQPIHDSQCGYRIYRLGSCEPVLMSLTLDRFDGETEVIIRATLERLRIGFTPIAVIYPNGASHKSHYRVFRDTGRIVWFYVKEFCRRIFTKSGRDDIKRLKSHVYHLRHDPWHPLLEEKNESVSLDRSYDNLNL